jgi:anti-sigma B factor antagonist
VSEEDIQETGEQLYRLVEKEGLRNLLLDFGAVRYMSSAALGKLISLKKKLGHVNGRMKLCSIQPELLEVFRITRLDTVFEIYKDARSALERF